ERQNNSDIKIDIINPTTGEDISKNTEIMQYLSDNSLTHNIIDAAKKGTPVVRLGDGSQPRVMITAGVHGNELPPQIASLKIIEELKGIELNGTIYIIPFIAPRATAENSKLFNGENLNLVADSPESATNKVFKYAEKQGIRSLGDYHSTSTHPAEDSVIYYTSIKSSSIAVFVNKKSNSRLLTHIINPGTLITVCNSNKIPTIICEAESPDGIASPDTIEVAMKQMKAFLEYHRIIG
ncbi:MAG: succinylglutamate desuccinylase/aspartoacylase family protein, partial [Methanobacterium sp.]|nr:succinylglutamate desuccinylase/aspartoacylase family protein [Methanobacterium sp.]